MQRYEDFINGEYISGLLGGHEYSLEAVTPALRRRIGEGIDRIVFTGMGCSAIVSDVVRGYLLWAGADVEVHVVNDYDLVALIPSRWMADPRTLFVISSYSGHSAEPIKAFNLLAPVRDRVLLLTSGGRLGELGQSTGTSVAYWRLSRPDREYPLFHVTQYFAILLTMFIELGLLPPALQVDFAQLATEVERMRPDAKTLGASLAQDARDSNVLMMAPPLYRDAMLKLCKMHLNEIAMVPASHNFFHDFCHSEVATLSDPDRRHCVLSFSDRHSDDYTVAKSERLLSLLTGDVSQNRLISARLVPMAGMTFLEKLFSTLDVVQHITLELTRYREVESRDLISEAAGNPWYHSATIAAEQSYV
jgi:glucose/mannose-6-phosphate isomerase